MLMTQAHRPMAAPDLPFIISGVKCGFEMQFCSTHVHAFSGVLSLSKFLRSCLFW